jgi:uncharacterized phiE125 gp8 family phage protein
MREVIRGAITGAEPVTLVVAKASARIETDVEDLLVYGFIRTAREEAEAFTRRALVVGSITQTFSGSDLPGFFGAIELKWVPVTALVKVSCVQASTGATTELTLADYELTAYADSAFVAPKAGKTWPMDAAELRIECTCGYASTEVPYLAKTAILYRVGQLYADREGNALAADRTTFERLLYPLRIGWFQ